MMRKSGMRILALALLLSLAGEPSFAQKRINFQRGKSSATVRGNIGSKGYLEYVVNGRAGQLMSIEITSGNGGVIINAGSASGKNFSLDMTGGDHTLSVVNTKSTATNYTLKVTIK